MAVHFSALMCHAPIVVPAVGGAEAEPSAATTAAMEEIAQRLVASDPDVVVVISPHTPRLPGAFTVLTSVVSGNFSRFGVPARDASVAFSGSPAFIADLVAAAAGHGVAVEAVRLRELDHGAVVPLWFLGDAGYVGQVVVVGLPDVPTVANLDAFAAAITDAAASHKVAFIASGDCSHRLIEGAPSGFDPLAVEFDHALRDALLHGGRAALDAIPDAVRERAAEDAWDTARLGLAVVDDRAIRREVLSYEGPYGVGYLCAVLHDDPAAAVTSADELDDAGAGAPRGHRALLDVANDALDAWLTGRDRAVYVDVDATDVTGVFVTWRHHGELRGCIGTLALEGAAVDHVVAEYAVAAASRDARFAPVASVDEARWIKPEISLLQASLPVHDLRDLDPKVWGIEVSRGQRRGVLLPDLDGVETVTEQLHNAKSKAGIAVDEDCAIRRFRVHKIA
jgi:AMMECR1 domain-containing protein/aromatic ring-opening dioxygenase LigB subunit